MYRKLYAQFGKPYFCVRQNASQRGVVVVLERGIRFGTGFRRHSPSKLDAPPPRTCAKAQKVVPLTARMGHWIMGLTSILRVKIMRIQEVVTDHINQKVNALRADK